MRSSKEGCKCLIKINVANLAILGIFRSRVMNSDKLQKFKLHTMRYHYTDVFPKWSAIENNIILNFME